MNMCSFGIKIKRNSKMSSVRELKRFEPSLCIPRVFPNITDERVANVIQELELGEIDRIDMVERETREGELYQRVFIHFKSWSSSAEEVRERLVNGEEIKIVYDDPWFWKVSASRSKRPRGPTERRAPRIEFSSGAPARAAARGACGDAIVAAQHEEEDSLNKGLSVASAAELKRRLTETPPPPPLSRSWGSC